MIILLDENLPHRLRHELPDHDVSTVFFRGWTGKKNGQLVALCEENKIDVLVTSDQNLSFQQNLRGKHLALVVLPSNDIEVLRGLSRRMALAVNQAIPGSYQFVILDDNCLPEPVEESP